MYTILVIDDEQSIRRSYSNFLEDHNYTTLEASNGHEGMMLLKEKKPDLVLVDLHMPDIDGLDILAWVAEHAPDTPTIVCSGTGVIRDVIEALRFGAWDYILKPVQDFSVLLHAINKAIERARLIRENKLYNLHLESEVEKRTQQVEQANINLLQLNNRLRQIVETTKTITSETHAGRFGSLLLNEFGLHMSAKGGCLYFSEKNGLRLVHALDPGHAADYIPFPLPEKSILSNVYHSGRPLVLSDITQNIDYCKSGWNGYQNNSVLSFPLIDENGNVFGLLSLHSKETPPFVDQDKEVGEILASFSCQALRASSATEELKKSEKKFRKFTESAPVAIIIYQDNRWIYANPAAEKLMAAPLIELSSLEFSDIIHHDFKHIYQNNSITNLSDAFLKTSHELKIIARDGSEKWVNFRTEKIEFEGENAIMVSAMDIGDLKQSEIEKQRLEIQLRQAQKMESIGTLAGGIAHDFNNILSSVIGYAELTLADLSEDKPASKQNMQAILRAGGRARDLVSQILTFSRQTELVNIPIKMHMIANEVLKLLRSSIPTTIEIIHKIQKCKPILADPTQIHQVIMNLCTNAFHAMQRSGGVMTVNLSPVEIQAQDSERIADLSPGSYAKLEVIDTGIGMSQSTIERIFDPYFTTKEKGKGTGLGLAVVHGIINNHNGAITVKSIPGQGSTFSVFLPVVDDSETQITTQKKSLPRGTEHILLVDDEKEIVLIEQQMLERLGYTVTTRAGSIDALNVFQANPLKFDMIITDMTMPNMTGDQLAREIIKIRPEIPIILCTGFSEYMNDAKAKSMGIHKYVLKPVSMEEIATAIRDVLDGKRS